MSKGSKEYFILKKGIDNIKHLRHLEDTLGKALHLFDKELNSKHFSLGEIEKRQIELLQMMFNDTHSDSWISYFIYECDLGKDPLQVTLASGKKVKMKTVSNLWEVIKED